MGDDKPHAGQIGAAGVQLVASRLLLHCITPNFPIWDSGYDVIGEYKSRTTRLQVKTQLRQPDARRHLSTFSFPLYRRKTGVVTVSDDSYIPRKSLKYDGAQFEAMVFVNLEHNAVFVVPLTALDLNRSKITFPADSPWREAWWVLKKSTVAKPRAAARRKK